MSIQGTAFSFQPNAKIRWILASFLVISLLSQCASDKDTNLVPSRDKLEFSRLTESSDIQSLEAEKRRVDSLYASIPSPNAMDKWLKLRFDFEYWWVSPNIEYPKGIALADSMIELIDSDDNLRYMKREMAETYLIRGDVYRVKGEIDKAYTNYISARIIGMDIEDRCLLANYDARFAAVLYNRQDFQDAVKYFRAALANVDECRNESMYFQIKQRWTDDLAISFARQGQYDSAMVYHQRALDFINSNSEVLIVDEILLERARAVIYGNMGQTYLALGQIAKAIELMGESIRINSKPGLDNNDANLTRIHLANHYIKSGKFDVADRLLSEVRSDEKSYTIAQTRARWLSAASNLYEARSNFEQALITRTQYLALNDSLNRLTKTLFDAQASNEYNRILQQREIERLVAKDEARTIFLFAAFIVSIFFVIIIISIVYAWKKTQRYNADLQVLNLQINEQKTELENTVRLLEIANQDKDRILWMVAHDLRNPVGAIRSMTELIIDEQNLDEIKEVIGQIQFASHTANQFIDEILVSAKGSKPDQKLDVYKHSLMVVQLLDAQVKLKQQHIFVKKPSKSLYVSMIPDKFIRVISNLVTNAIKFSDLKSEINIDIRQYDSRVQIRVIDEGIGIPESLKKDLFDSFTNSTRPGTEGETTTGLGLSSVKRIVEQYYGQIRHEDNPKGGSIFIIDLPAA
jgi:two-component system, OmpR family, sensor histidine kinase VicK